jgi:hypothetical protein
MNRDKIARLLYGFSERNAFMICLDTQKATFRYPETLSVTSVILKNT